MIKKFFLDFKLRTFKAEQIQNPKSKIQNRMTLGAHNLRPYNDL